MTRRKVKGEAGTVRNTGPIHGWPCAKESERLRTRIEQAIARGMSAPRIATEFEVSVVMVHEVWDALDEAVGVPTLGTEARAEAAAFYARTCPEYHNGRP